MGARSDSNAGVTGSPRPLARGLLACLAAVSAAQAVERPLAAPSPYASITRSDRAKDHDLLAWGCRYAAGAPARVGPAAALQLPGRGRRQGTNHDRPVRGTEPL